MTNSTHTVQVNNVLQHIRTLLDSGRLLPGDRLPAERKMAEQLGVSRAHVRTAFQKLEFYGIVKTYPQSGTVVAQQTVQVLESLITDMLQIDSYDFYSLVYVRMLLETEAVKLCAQNRTETDIETMKAALESSDNYLGTDRQVEKDFAFHSSIARGAHNPVIASLLLVITPDVLNYFRKFRVCDISQEQVRAEHHQLLDAIIAGDAPLAEQLLRNHLRDITQFATELKDTGTSPSPSTSSGIVGGR